MSYERKFNAAINELKEKTDLKEKIYMPLLYKLLKKAGIKIRPPCYYPFILQFLILITFFSFFWGGLMYLFYTVKGLITFGIILSPFFIFKSALLFGVFMGLVVAGGASLSARKYKLSKWESL